MIASWFYILGLSNTCSILISIIIFNFPTIASPVPDGFSDNPNFGVVTLQVNLKYVTHMKGRKETSLLTEMFPGIAFCHCERIEQPFPSCDCSQLFWNFECTACRFCNGQFSCIVKRKILLLAGKNGTEMKYYEMSLGIMLLGNLKYCIWVVFSFRKLITNLGLDIYWWFESKNVKKIM